jgi:hypothetical protein
MSISSEVMGSFGSSKIGELLSILTKSNILEVSALETKSSYQAVHSDGLESVTSELVDIVENAQHETAGRLQVCGRTQICDVICSDGRRTRDTCTAVGISYNAL